MNTSNNKRYRDTAERIENIFFSLLQSKAFDEITVQEICREARIERSTFYAHYKDLYDLANCYSTKIEQQVKEQPCDDQDFTWLFEYIKANKKAFHVYFKLSPTLDDSDYKTLFFRNGVYAVAKTWFQRGCLESTREMGNIVLREYRTQE